MGVMYSMKNKKPLIIGASVGLAAVVIAAVLLLLKCSGDDREPEVIDTLTPQPTVSAEPAETAAVVTEAPATDTPAPTFTPEPYTVTMRSADGFVKACSTGTYGVASDGTVRFMGRSVSGQNLVFGWQSVIDLELNDRTTAALRRDGAVRLTGAQSKAFAESLEWTGVVDLAMGGDFLLGLKTDGTVISCGSEAMAGAVSEWINVKKLAAGSDFAAGLSTMGVFVTSEVPAEAIAGDVADISAAGSRLVLLMRDGHVRVIDDITGVPTVHELEWQRIARVFASPNAVYAIDDQAKLWTDAEFVDEEVTDAYCVAASEKHAVVLKGNGRCVGFGENKDMQCAVSNWRLLPYLTSEGWLIGYGPDTYMGSEVLRTGYELTYVEPATGEQSPAVVVIMGDANGDGKIDESDVTAVKNHISGSKKLEGPFLRAATVINDSSKSCGQDRP